MATDISPTVTPSQTTATFFDYTSFPHLFDRVVSHLDWSTLLTFRGASRAVYDQVNAIIYRHVLLDMPTCTEDTLLVKNPYNHKPLLWLNNTNRNTPDHKTLTFAPSHTLDEAVSILKRYTRIVDVQLAMDKGSCPRTVCLTIWH